jgi:hypothetical protein
MDCLRKLTTMTWHQVLDTGGKGGNKHGLGHTPYNDHTLKGAKRPSGISEDLKISAVRASQKYRVYGFYLNHIFYILWFDRNHEIVPD